MMICNEDKSALPTINFVAGETQNLVFHAFFCENNSEFDLTDCRCSFAIANPLGALQTIVRKDMIVSGNTISVKLLTNDTVGLCGKYIYQISIKDVDGNTEIPGHGIMYISRNIDKVFK